MRRFNGRAELGRVRMNSLLLSAFLSHLVSILMTLADTLISGNILGESALSAISLVAPIYTMGVFISNLISIGCSSLFLKYMGLFKKDRANEYFTIASVLSVLAGLFMFIVFFFCKDLYFNFLNVTGEVRDYAVQYYFWIDMTLLILPIYTCFTIFVYADGDTKVSALSAISQIFANIGLSIVLTHFMGPAGVGLGTFIGTAFSTVVAATHFTEEHNTLHFTRKVNLKKFFTTIPFTITNSISYLGYSILLTVLNKIVVVNFGSVYIPVVTVIYNLLDFSMFFAGVGDALDPLANIYLAEENEPAEKKLAVYSFKMSAFAGFLAALLLAFIAEWIPVLFNITSPSLIRVTATSVRIVSAAVFLVSILYILAEQYQLMEHIRLATTITIVRSCLLPSLLALPMAQWFGMYGIPAAITCALLLTLVGTLVFVRLRYGKEKYPFLIDGKNERILTVSSELTVEGIVSIRDRVMDYLEKNGIGERMCMRIGLVIEEILVLVKDRNEKTVLGECSVFLEKNAIRVILRDSGILFDITDSDAKIRDFRTYVVSAYMGVQREKNHLITTSINRNVLVFRTDKGEDQWR